MEIVTKRFLLRDFNKEDEPAFFAYHADPRYAQFCAPEEVAPNHTRELLWLFGQWAAEHPRLNYQLAIVDRRSSGELIGCAGLRREGYGVERAELGIELAPQFWGRYARLMQINLKKQAFFRQLSCRQKSGQRQLFVWKA